MTHPQAIWLRLQDMYACMILKVCMYDIKSSSRQLALKEELYALNSPKGKAIEEHL